MSKREEKPMNLPQYSFENISRKSFNEVDVLTKLPISASVIQVMMIMIKNIMHIVEPANFTLFSCNFDCILVCCVGCHS